MSSSTDAQPEKGTISDSSIKEIMRKIFENKEYMQKLNSMYKVRKGTGIRIPRIIETGVLGTVKTVPSGHENGFISRHNGKEDIAFYTADITDGCALAPGQLVQFNVNQENRLKAVAIRPFLEDSKST